MSKLENIDTKILIDALKYTSNIIVDITNKLSEQENKINKLENATIKIQKYLTELNHKINQSGELTQINNKNQKQISSYNKITSNHNNKITLENDTECEKIASFLLEKNNNDSDELDRVNSKLKENIFKDKNKIDKLINSIVKKKNSLETILENKKEKSLLTDYNIEETNLDSEDKINNELDYNTNTNGNTNINDNTNDNTNNLKNIRRKSNFARRL